MILIFCAFAFVLRAVSGAETEEKLPPWISESQGFRTPEEMDLIRAGEGCVQASGAGSKGWLVSLNEREGHGVELALERLSLDPDSGDFFIISTWPLGTGFKQMQMFTGKFEEPQKKIHIPNIKTFFLLYSAADGKNLAEVKINFRRYGTPLEPLPPPTENPAKKKETIFEVQLRGKAPEELVAPALQKDVKEAVRAAASRYCAAHNISFNQQIPTKEMVLIHKITFCPFEWPEREICASMKHSVFVSGLRIPNEAIILDYQLTADNLKVMWHEDNFPELEQLGITVFQLPPSYSIVSYWTVIIVLAIISSLFVTLIIWKLSRPTDTSSKQYSTAPVDTRKTKKPKRATSKHQRIPSFMYGNPIYPHDKELKESALMRASEESIDDLLKPGAPMKNYLANMVFLSTAFEDDEDKATVDQLNTVELRHKPPSLQQTKP